jgi:hypothetical protein
MIFPADEFVHRSRKSRTVIFLVIVVAQAMPTERHLRASQTAASPTRFASAGQESGGTIRLQRTVACRRSKSCEHVWPQTAQTAPHRCAHRGLAGVVSAQSTTPPDKDAAFRSECAGRRLPSPRACPVASSRCTTPARAVTAADNHAHPDQARDSADRRKPHLRPRLRDLYARQGQTSTTCCPKASSMPTARRVRTRRGTAVQASQTGNLRQCRRRTPRPYKQRCRR